MGRVPDHYEEFPDEGTSPGVLSIAGAHQKIDEPNIVREPSG